MIYQYTVGLVAYHPRHDEPQILASQISMTREEPHGNSVGYASPLYTPLPCQWGGEVLWLLEVGVKVD